MNKRLVTCLIMIYMGSVLQGCHKHRNPMVENVKRILEIVAANPTSSNLTKTRAREALDNWKNGRLDPVPVLVYAGYVNTPGMGDVLDLVMSDEDFNVEGIMIREVHHFPDANDVVLEECYPCFWPVTAGVAGIGHPRTIKFRHRTSLSERKDSRAWENWQRSYQTDPDHFFPRAYPNLWISYPEPNSIDVSICVYDSDGHRSGEVPVEKGFTSMRRPPGVPPADF